MNATDIVTRALRELESHCRKQPGDAAGARLLRRLERVLQADTAAPARTLNTDDVAAVMALRSTPKRASFGHLRRAIAMARGCAPGSCVNPLTLRSVLEQLISDGRVHVVPHCPKRGPDAGKQSIAYVLAKVDRP